MEFRTDYRNVAGEMPTVGSVDRLQIAAIVLVGSKSSVGTSYFTPSQLNASLKGLPQMETGIVHYEKRTGLSVIDFGKPGLASVYDLTGKLLKTTSDFSQINSMQKGVYIVKIMQNGKNFKRVFSTVK
jgi:hypothetical protein